MPFVVLDGISTRYEIVGDGAPLLMFAPGGFNATIEAWSLQGIYKDIKFLELLPKSYKCIVFDRRECGQSGGRIERVTWSHYVKQARELLDDLGIMKAHLLGGCMGCCVVSAFGTTHPDRTLSMTMWWPVGGARYRLSSHQRFFEHLAFVQSHGLQAVVDLVAKEGKPFGADTRGGPWASALKHDRDFSNSYAQQDLEEYKLIVAGMVRSLFDRDTAPGAEPEDMLRLNIPAFIVPGNDASHATSAARYLHECLPNSQYWDVSVHSQGAGATKVLEFLDSAVSY